MRIIILLHQTQDTIYLSCFSALFVIGFSITVSLRSVHASRQFHSMMLSNVLKAPQSFFDTTPTGRIVNRFSQDLDTIDNELPLTFEMFIDCAVLVLGTLIVISYSTPIFLVAIVPTAVLYTLIQVSCTGVFRQLYRYIQVFSNSNPDEFK